MLAPQDLSILFRRWGLVSKAIDALGAVWSVDAALEVLRAHTRRIALADGVCVVRRISATVLYVGEDAIAPLWTGQRFPIEQCVSGRAMIERQVILIPDIATDPRVPLNAYLSTFVASMAMIPLGSGEPFAALGLYWAQAQPIEPAALTLVETLARSANATFERLALRGAAA
ncbi:GAF domain-containing protein [Sphingomonas sp. NBWT7]|uniref:GAF domain-containing protein n=1 Tax=Sphingomonas sp. NBWT7 TaxID=2596913 RepID=UPI001626A509|nr:GAF domain-containing protein [Sphingomonas sp. NBWT7]QNE33054.1 GAF domain-containing protein [Sphingomonas sp. NBWT7]